MAGSGRSLRMSRPGRYQRMSGRVHRVATAAQRSAATDRDPLVEPPGAGREVEIPLLPQTQFGGRVPDRPRHPPGSDGVGRVSSPTGSTGEWPSGKAPDSGSGDRRFESFLASHPEAVLGERSGPRLLVLSRRGRACPDGRTIRHMSLCRHASSVRRPSRGSPTGPGARGTPISLTQASRRRR